MLTFFRATIETPLTVSEITARIQNRTYEADPNKWWWRDNIADKRWVGLVTYEKFILRRPYRTEGFFHPRLAGFYSQVGFDGVVTDREGVRDIAFEAVFLPKAMGVLGLLFLYCALCLTGIVLGDMHTRTFGMLLLGIFAFIARYMWWGYKRCAREELQFLSDVVDATTQEGPTLRH